MSHNGNYHIVLCRELTRSSHGPREFQTYQARWPERRHTPERSRRATTHGSGSEVRIIPPPSLTRRGLNSYRGTRYSPLLRWCWWKVERYHSLYGDKTLITRFLLGSSGAGTTWVPVHGHGQNLHIYAVEVDSGFRLFIHTALITCWLSL